MKQHWWDKEDEIYSWLYGKKGYGSPQGRSTNELLGYTYDQIKDCSTILDAGCGPCDFALMMMKHDYPGAIFGLDVCKYVVDHAPAGCSAIHGSLDDIPFDTDTFDGIWSRDVLEHIPPEKIDKVLMELRRVLKSDGKIALSISGVPAKWRGPQGEELHLTVRKIDWWTSLLASHDLPVEFQYTIPRREVFIIWG